MCTLFWVLFLDFLVTFLLIVVYFLIVWSVCFGLGVVSRFSSNFSNNYYVFSNRLVSVCFVPVLFCVFFSTGLVNIRYLSNHLVSVYFGLGVVSRFSSNFSNNYYVFANLLISMYFTLCWGLVQRVIWKIFELSSLYRSTYCCPLWTGVLMVMFTLLNFLIICVGGYFSIKFYFCLFSD